MIMQWDSVMLGLHTGYQEHRGEVAAPFWRRGSEELANVNLCQMKEFRGGQIWADQIAWGKIRRKGVYMNEKQTCGWRNKQVQMSKSFEGCGRRWLPKGCWGGFPGGTSGREPACSAGAIRDAGSIPGSGRSPVEERGNLLQYSCLENPMDSGAWWATVHGVVKSQTRLEWWSTHTHTRLGWDCWITWSFYF